MRRAISLLGAAAGRLFCRVVLSQMIPAPGGRHSVGARPQGRDIAYKIAAAGARGRRRHR